MPKNNRVHKNSKNRVELGAVKTDPKKVKQEIQQDLNEGQGVITSREAGSLRD